MMVWEDPIVVCFAQAFLALLFGGAALSKLRRQEEFFGVVRNFRVLPAGLVKPIAVMLPWAELAIAAGLLVPASAPYAALGAGLLLTVFGFAIGLNVFRGRRAIDCGCFRNGLKQPLSWSLVARNAVLSGTAFWLAAALPRAAGADATELAIGLMAAVIALLLYVSFSYLAGLSNASRTHGA